MRGIGGLVPRLWGWRPAWGPALTLNCYVKTIGCCFQNRYLFRGGQKSRLSAPSRRTFLHVHAAHAAHAARRAVAVFLVLRGLGHHDLGREQQARHRGGVLQRKTGHLGRVQNAGLEHVAELARGGVVAEGALAFLHTVENHGSVLAGVLDDLAQRLLDRAGQNADADRLVLIRTLEVLERTLGADQRHTAARHHALFHRSASRVQRVFDAGLLLFHLDLGGGSYLDHGDAAGELGNPLLQLLLVVVGGGLFGLLTDRLDARLDVGGLAVTVDDRGVFLLHDDLLGFAQIVQRRLLERQADFVGNDRAAGKRRDVLQHRLAAIAKARGLDRGHLEDAADVVDDQRRQCLTLEVLGDDQQRPAGLGHALEQRQQLPDVGNLLVDQQDHRLIQLGGLVLLIVDEVRGEVAAVELHALDHFQLVRKALAFLHRNHAFLADLLHRLGNGLADRIVGVRRDRAYLGNRLGVLAGLGELLQLLNGGDDRLVDTTLDVHRVAARGHGLEAFADDRLG